MGRWMRVTFAAEAGVAALFALWLLTGPPAPDDTLRVLVAAKILTMEPERPEAGAVAIQSGRLVAVGSRAEVRAALGDRSENADYIYGKKRLREIDRRISFIQKRLDELTVVDRAPDRDGVVYFGTWVTGEDEDGEEETYRVGGPDEFDPARHSVSMA